MVKSLVIYADFISAIHLLTFYFTATRVPPGATMYLLGLSWLDYCYSLLSDMSDIDLIKFRRVLNRLACVVTKSPPFTRSVPLLLSLHLDAS